MISEKTGFTNNSIWSQRDSVVPIFYNSGAVIEKFLSLKVFKSLLNSLTTESSQKS